MTVDEKFIKDLPDREAALRFLDHLAEGSPAQFAKLQKNNALLSDVLTLVTFSPLLATTLLQNAEYFSWLDRMRRDSGVSSKEDLLESLARFSLTNSQFEPQVLFARFRRRELLRIYLRDIRRLATIAEVTEEISNLADATLEYALRLARNEMDARFGPPQESDEKGRPLTARFCVAALGKLGSRELNYSSDIDLTFLYSNEGTTSGTGSRGAVTNREYFVKLAEYLTKLIGQPTGEGAAYRVDLRLRPHGSLGPLAQSVDDVVRYYETEARPWERQVMIRSRGCAGDTELFRTFFERIENLIFSKELTVDDALANVRGSKQKIDLEQVGRRGFDVKLGRGGIREIEFIAQALQLAHGGRDEWLRVPHTLISLDRLRDRGYISDAELSDLAAAYDLLRRTEHILQMEEGVQTHSIPEDAEKRKLLAKRVRFATSVDLERQLTVRTAKVHRIFVRIFGPDVDGDAVEPTTEALRPTDMPEVRQNSQLIEKLSAISPHFGSVVSTNPRMTARLVEPTGEINSDYSNALMSSIGRATSFRDRITALRQTWSGLLMEIVANDAFQMISVSHAKHLQTILAEASIAAAIEIVGEELAARYKFAVDHLPLAVLALGKLGGRGVDYDSDLDLVLVYDADTLLPKGITHTEFFSRSAELFVTTLSSMTRDGHLYRVDLRLRPYGTKGLSAMPSDAFLEYMRKTAATWEMLAFVKLRAVGGDMEFGRKVERGSRSIIHERAQATDTDELRNETAGVRHALEEQRSRNRRGGDLDIKYGAGGMLDVYFAMRYLQLRHNVPDDQEDRSTLLTLQRLFNDGTLSDEAHGALSIGYSFLSLLDHNIRLTVGRTTKVPVANDPVMKTIAARMDLDTPSELLQELTLHRLAIRATFNAIVGLN